MTRKAVYVESLSFICWRHRPCVMQKGANPGKKCVAIANLVKLIFYSRKKLKLTFWKYFLSKFTWKKFSPMGTNRCSFLAGRCNNREKFSLGISDTISSFKSTINQENQVESLSFTVKEESGCSNPTHGFWGCYYYEDHNKILFKIFLIKRRIEEMLFLHINTEAGKLHAQIFAPYMNLKVSHSQLLCPPLINHLNGLIWNRL